LHGTPEEQTEHLHPTGWLQPLEVPSAVWADIAMGFIEGFPQINGKSVTLTVIDRFSKYARFIPMGHPYIASHSSGMCLHGIPSSIVSDRNLVLKSNFWHKLFSLAGVKLQLPSAFHLQSETTNKIITMYLRCLVRDRPQQ
jgi:hypothetical protein